MNNSSMERIIPEALVKGDITGEETLRLHLDRYRFALDNIKPGRVLDIACGVGYGTHFLLKNGEEKISQIIGCDISEFAIDYAKKKYSNPKIIYVLKDAYEFSDAEGFDTIVSLETIEHLPDIEKFISNISLMLRPGGKWINSVPVTPTMDAIPFHLHDFTQDSFRRLFKRVGYQEINQLLQIQSFSPLRVLGRKEKRMESLRDNLLLYYVLNPRSLMKRIFSTFVNGFKNHYLTVVWEKIDTSNSFER
ncbi:MAG: class I SAM-dependent methyltransferase [Elusimicrobiota bacterium]